MTRKTPYLLLALLFAPAVLPAEVLNRVVLRVNDQIATLYDYERRRAELTQEIVRRTQDPEERRRLLAGVGEATFKDMYEELLLESRAEQLAVEVSEAQIQQGIANMKQNFGIENDEQFAAALAQSGMTEAALREQLRRNIRMREVMGREVQSRIQVDEEDLRRVYRRDIEQFRQPEQLQLREVVVLEEGGLPAGERAQVAQQIRQAVAGGKSLADAVAEHAAKGAASNVIEIGWVSPGDLDPGLEAAVWKLPAGAVSEPVAGRGGLHILQVIERRESRVPTFAEVQQQIEQRERERVYREELDKYMAELEKTSLVVANPPAEAEGFRRLLSERPAADDPALADFVRRDANPEVPGDPGALPEPKPVTNTMDPVVDQQSPVEPPPPPPVR